MVWAAIGAAAVGVIGSAIMAPDPSSGGQQQGQQQGQQGPAPGGQGGGQSIGGAIGNLYLTDQGAKNIQAAGTTAAGMSDPFAQSRQLANTQLQSLMQNPGSMANDPQAKFAMDQGIQATNRGIAAKHQTNSGNAQMELMNYGQGMSNQNYNNRLNQLSTMASQGASPGTAGQQYLGATETAQSGLTAGGMGVMAAASPFISSAGSALGSAIGNGIGGYFSNNQGSSVYSNTPGASSVVTGSDPFGGYYSGNNYNMSNSYSNTGSYSPSSGSYGGDLYSYLGG